MKQAARPIPIDKSQIRKVTQTIYKEALDLLEQVRVHPRFEEERIGWWPQAILKNLGIDKWVYTYTTTLVGSDTEVSFPIFIKFSGTGNFKTRKYISGGRVQHVGRPGDKRLRPINLKIEFSTELTKETFVTKKSKILDEIFSVLIHEITHTRDWIPLKRKPHQQDPQKYYNEPAEVRAFMQQIADEVISYPLESFDKADQFRRALERSTTWDRIKRVLSSPNKKKIYSGVWTAYEEAIQKGEIVFPFEVTRYLKPEKLLRSILDSRDLLDHQAEYFSETSTLQRLKTHMQGLAENEMLSDALAFGEYGFKVDLPFSSLQRIEKDFQNLKKISRILTHFR